MRIKIRTIECMIFFSSSEIDAKKNSNTMFLSAWISNANEFAIFVIRTDSINFNIVHVRQKLSLMFINFYYSEEGTGLSVMFKHLTNTLSLTINLIFSYLHSTHSKHTLSDAATRVSEFLSNRRILIWANKFKAYHSETMY